MTKKYFVNVDTERGGYEVLDNDGNKPLGQFNYMFHGESQACIEIICRFLNSLVAEATHYPPIAQPAAPEVKIGLRADSGGER